MPRETTYKDSVGKRPDADTYTGGYGYGGVNRDGTGGGYQGGFGIQSGLLGSKEGWHAKSELLSGGGYAGLNHDGGIGMGAGGRVAHIEGGYGERGKGNYFNADADALGADAGAWINPDKGMGAGASAYLLQGSVTAGNIGTGARDEEGRFGLGYGVGGAGRLHWDDADGDGRREYGFGADIGPVSFDYRTEDPLMSLAKANPIGMLASPLIDRFVPQDFNLTETVGNGISSAASAVGNGISSAASAVGDAASYVGGGISNAAGAAWDAVTGW